MRPGHALLWTTVASFASGVAACASLVGADFGDVTARPPDGGVSVGDGAATGTDGQTIASDGGSCPAGLSDCDGFCVDLQTDPAHCGACATACPSDLHGPGVCVTNACSLACTTGWVRCATGCCSQTGIDDSGVEAGPPDAGAPDTGHPDPGLPCGTDVCTIDGTTYCCGNHNGNGDVCTQNPNASCIYTFDCDDSAECTGGDVCCYDDSATASTCAATCDSPLEQFCNPDSSGACPPQQSCTGVFTQNDLATTYHYCQ